MKLGNFEQYIRWRKKEQGKEPVGKCHRLFEASCEGGYGVDTNREHSNLRRTLIVELPLQPPLLLLRRPFFQFLEEK